jgi:manganese-dependent inorganic pyrophosphatase
VSAVIDHHPPGTRAFRLRSRTSRWAATLLVERFQQAGIEPSTPTAGLLAAAIISNTLNMTAPSTDERDHRALNWLRERVSGLDESFVREMFAAHSDVANVPTAQLLVSNIKSFRTGSHDVGIVQIETTDAVSFLRRPDLGAEPLTWSRHRTPRSSASIADICRPTTLVALSPSTREGRRALALSSSTLTR